MDGIKRVKTTYVNCLNIVDAYNFLAQDVKTHFLL